MSYPVVLVVEDGGPSAEEIIKNIRKVSAEEDVHTFADDSKGYRYRLVTKYYETNLLLVPAKSVLDGFLGNLMNGVEGVLISFNAKNRDFLKVIPKYANFLKSHQIELGVLLCEQLSEDEAGGITYREAKQCSKVLDVIELSPRMEEDAEDEEEDPHNPTGYGELIQALKGFLWSSAEVSNVYHRSNGYSAMDPNDEEDEDDPEVSATVRNVEHVNSGMNEAEITAELANYERLLSEVIQFRSTTSSWTRNERLAYAQEFANLFDELLGIDSASDDEVEEDPIPVNVEESAEVKDKMGFCG
ncbi:uncharacterized protein DMENIID0001_043650 [Sergentomyia squamirostris]